MIRLRLVGLAAFVALVAVACSVVDDGKVSRIDPPFALDDTLPTSTEAQTTTTVLVTTTTGLDTTTTLVQTEQVRLYFIASGQLTYVGAALPSPVALPQVIAALQAGPPAGDLGRGLRSAVPPDALILVTTDGSGIAQIELPDGFFDDVSVGDQRLVIAQLVLTFTDSRGVGQVAFNQPVPKPSGEVAEAGQPLAYRDYQSLAGSNPPATTTTSSIAAAITTTAG